MKKLIPNYLFEASWEVCNRVGGIYTVLSTKAASLVSTFGDKVLFVGPDVWGEAESPFFIEDKTLFADWVLSARERGLKVRIGRWQIPGEPVVILVDFRPFYASKNEFYAAMWQHFEVDSLHAYGDYDEASMFGYAAGVVMADYVRFYAIDERGVVAHFNEWMTAFGGLYLRQAMPQVATLFTTHATSIGRSIAGNNKPLYDYLHAYNGVQMAEELNMQSKHSVERQAARWADCFTTVSEVTARECEQLLDRAPDVITPNGFENGFVPKAAAYKKRRAEARALLRRIAERVLGYKLSEDVLMVGTSGRYEYKNKGIDVFVEAVRRASDYGLERDVVAFVMVPAYIAGPRLDLTTEGEPLQAPHLFATHYLHEEQNDAVLGAMRWFGLNNDKHDRVKMVFVPSYLNGDDGVFNKDYYDLLIGLDLTVFPSYYEPWGYTPLESAAFSVPTITTNLSGFGQWVSDEPVGIENGVGVVRRTDYNYGEVVASIAHMIASYTRKTADEVKQINKKAYAIAQKALWKHFIKYYYEAFEVAMRNRDKRIE